MNMRMVWVCGLKSVPHGYGSSGNRSPESRRTVPHTHRLLIPKRQTEEGLLYECLSTVNRIVTIVSFHDMWTFTKRSGDFFYYTGLSTLGLHALRALPCNLTLHIFILEMDVAQNLRVLTCRVEN